MDPSGNCFMAQRLIDDSQRKYSFYGRSYPGFEENFLKS